MWSPLAVYFLFVFSLPAAHWAAADQTAQGELAPSFTEIKLSDVHPYLIPFPSASSPLDPPSLYQPTQPNDSADQDAPITPAFQIPESGFVPAQVPAPAPAPAPRKEPEEVHVDVDMHKVGYPGIKFPVRSTEPLKIAVVANGKSVLKKKMGKTIDSFDLVVRFNYFRLKGFEPFVGSKTNLWFLGELKEPGPKGTRGMLGKKGGTMDLSIHPDSYMVPIVYPAPKRCGQKKTVTACSPKPADVAQRKKTRKLVNAAYAKFHLDKKLEILPIELEQLLQVKYGYTQTWPSSGVLAIVYCLESFPNAQISTYGYDFGTVGLGHYWEKIKKKTTVHNMKGERNFQEQLVKTGRVHRLA